MRSKRGGYDMDLKEEKKLFSSFRSSNRGTHVSKKLCFDESGVPNTHGNGKITEGSDTVIMQIDDSRVVIPCKLQRGL